MEAACTAIKRSNPALLKEIALQLSSIISPSAKFNPETLCVIDKGTPRADISICYSDLAAYLTSATGKYVPVLFDTASQTVESRSVFVYRDWLNRRLKAARENLGIAQILEIPAANNELAFARSVNTSSTHAPIDQPPPLSEAGYKNLICWLKQQNDQRKAYEAASKDALALQQREQEIAELRAMLVAKDAQIQQARDGWEQSLRELIEERRDRTKLADMLQQHVGIIEFMNPNNPYSPTEGRRLVAAWCELTENGTVDVVSEAGIGLSVLCLRWLEKQSGEPAAIVVKRFTWALGWPARKNGGVVAKRKKEKE
ncbi:hypothetical protein [Azotobacter beijerinckii]|nr:hypothetical protein [Azotobacter beijerinckii]